MQPSDMLGCLQKGTDHAKYSKVKETKISS